VNHEAVFLTAFFMDVFDVNSWRTLQNRCPNRTKIDLTSHFFLLEILYPHNQQVAFPAGVELSCQNPFCKGLCWFLPTPLESIDLEVGKPHKASFPYAVVDIGQVLPSQ